MIFWQNGSAAVYRDLLDSLDVHYLPPEEVVRRVRQILSDARSAATRFILSQKSNPAVLSELAEHAIRLAKLDPICRANRLGPQFQEADPEDVQEFLELLRIVPFDALIDGRFILLNPSFADASNPDDSSSVKWGIPKDNRVGSSRCRLAGSPEMKGSFADLTGEQKVTEELIQVLPFDLVLLCRLEAHDHVAGDEIRVSAADTPFAVTEEWFWNRAEQEFGARTNLNG